MCLSARLEKEVIEEKQPVAVERAPIIDARWIEYLRILINALIMKLHNIILVAHKENNSRDAMVNAFRNSVSPSTVWLCMIPAAPSARESAASNAAGEKMLQWLNQSFLNKQLWGNNHLCSEQDCYLSFNQIKLFIMLLVCKWPEIKIFSTHLTSNRHQGIPKAESRMLQRNIRLLNVVTVV